MVSPAVRPYASQEPTDRIPRITPAMPAYGRARGLPCVIDVGIWDFGFCLDLVVWILDLLFELLLRTFERPAHLQNADRVRDGPEPLIPRGVEIVARDVAGGDHDVAAEARAIR